MGRQSCAVACILALASAPGGCGHDWSAADSTDAVPDVADAAETADAADADGDAGSDADGGETDVPAEAADDAGDDAGPDVAPCDPTLESCTDGRLRRCAPDGSGWEEVVCAFGCVPDELRCLQLAPANVTDDTLLDRGTTPFGLDAGARAVFDTGTGEIVVYGGTGTDVLVVRPPGVGTLAGIPFTVEDQGSDAAGLGTWVFSQLAVTRGATVYATGPNAMVLLVGGDVSIDGVIDVGGVPDDLGGGRGPAAGAGGASEEPGQGAGGGRPGRSLGWNEDPGAGGGGYGGRGGKGGDTTMAPGGSGGTSWGVPELCPLLGGSGGGGSGGRGGAGGGALQISAAGRLMIGEGGGITAGGRGGQGGQSTGGAGSGGGGGGGSGGAVLLEAAEVAIRGGVACNGGGGGAGARSTDAPGADGADGTLTAGPGAAGGEGRGSGTSGGAGSDAERIHGAAGINVEPLSLDDAGGGGGGAGRIRLQGPTIAVEGFLSPAEATGLATRGDCATR